MRRIHLVALVLIALALGLLGAGCLDGTETTATPETVVGTLPAAAPELTGDPTAGKAIFTSAGCVGCHTLADAGSTGNVGPNLDEAKPDSELVVKRVTNGRPAHGSADRGRRCIRRPGNRRLILPPSFPRDVQAFACDFDRTLVGRDGLLRPRTRAAITRSQAAGIPVVVATGRMFRSVRPYLDEAGISDLVVCYQGAAVVDPVSGTFVLHEPIALETAREAIETLTSLGHSPNCYVDDRLYVSERTEYSRMYAGFQHLQVEEVGDLAAWLTKPPTKLVAVADPAEIPVLRAALASAFGDRLFLTTSLPYLLELGNPAVSKGTGIAFVARELGISLERIVSFGDGENDLELIAEAGFGIAVEDANPLLLGRADWICPSANEEGVATVIDAYLDWIA